MKKKRQGFTMVELLMGIALSSFLMAGSIALFTYSNQAYVKQDDIVSAQQFVRSAMEIMVHELRMAGYVPPEIVSELGGYEQIEEATATAITFIADLNADGNPEKIRYTIDGILLTREAWEWDTGTSIFAVQTEAVALAENITGFSLLYVYEDGTTGIPATADEREDIRAVTLTITGRSANIDPNFTAADGTSYHYRSLMSYITLRNMGLT